MDDFLEEEFAQPYRDWQQKPTPRSSSELLKAVDPVIRSAIKSYAGTSGPLIYSRARRLTLEALPKYDPGRGKLRTHLMNQLQGLRRIQQDQEQVLSVPEKVRLDHFHLGEARKRLTDWLGRDPSDDELADETGLSLKRLGHIRKYSPGVSEGFLNSLADHDDDSGTFEPSVQPTDDGAGWTGFVYRSLPPTDQLIMEHKLGLNNRRVLSNQAIAKKLGLTPSAVSQRSARIQEHLNARQNLGIL